MIEIEKIIRDSITSALGGLNLPTTDFTIEHPDDLTRGDYATNVALMLGKETKKNPMEIAEKIADKLKVAPLESLKVRPWLERVEVVAPGFLNFFLTPEFFTSEMSLIIAQGDKYGEGITERSKRVMIEYTDPNPFKEFHIGHLMSNTIGEAISRLVASQGAEVKRACYQGDVGLHVAKAIWGRLKLKTQNAKEIEEWGKAYTLGSKAYENDEATRQEIVDFNKKIYERSDKSINDLYDAGKKVSLDYFETIYRRLGTKFDFYFFESESGQFGKKLVEENVVKVFEKSDGAMVFKGEKYNLHTRVFINADDLPTYEAKELGLAKIKYDRYPYDQSIVITGNEVKDYFRVLLKALELISPALAEKTLHLTHGMLRLPTGKMSSRVGNVVTAESLLDEVKSVVKLKIAERDFTLGEQEAMVEAVAVAAIKYSILKQAPGRNIIFDLGRSVSLEGDSGPYLQYAYVRAQAVLAKANAENIQVDPEIPPAEISDLERRLGRFPEVVARATRLYAPNLLVTYLTELAASFNTYYATQKIVDAGDPHAPYRLATTLAFSHLMKSGLTLLAIPTPERM
ncbi:MAG: arginine--tRNA ligase [Patescibacteria group bacterium]